MAELLFIKLDPQNVEKLFHHLLTTELCSTVSQYCFYPILILSVSPCILLSVMSALCVQRSGRIADYFLIYLQAAERIEWLKPAQYLSAWMCVHARANPIWEEGLCIWEPFVCAHLCLCLRVYVRASPTRVWDLQLSGSATGGECWSVSLFDPSLPPHITTWEILIGLIPSYVFYFISSSTLLSNPALPLVSPFLGTQLSETTQ